MGGGRLDHSCCSAPRPLPAREAEGEEHGGVGEPGLGCQAEGKKTRFAPTFGHRTIGRPGPKIVPCLPMRQANHQRESQSGRLIASR